MEQYDAWIRFDQKVQRCKEIHECDCRKKDRDGERYIEKCKH